MSAGPLTRSRPTSSKTSLASRFLVLSGGSKIHPSVILWDRISVGRLAGARSAFSRSLPLTLSGVEFCMLGWTMPLRGSVVDGSEN